METIVIVGGVAAGATAAARARRLSPTAKIVLLEAGPDISFANCGLPYYIGGDIKARSSLILQSPESFRDQYAVEVHTHTLVTRIDQAAHEVHATDTRNGDAQTFQYTKLILAQGGRPITPSLPGAELEHVFTLWTLEDMDRIARHIDAKKPRSAVVVGGGFIGLEMVEALAKRSLHVSVVELMPHVMSIMAPEIAGFIHAELIAHGVDVYPSTAVTEITSRSVRLDKGTTIEAELVLLSVGVRPTLQLAKEAGLALGEAGGLLVDAQLRTSDPDIFAAGDMVELEHRVSGKKTRIPLAGPANRQGRIAAENALGGSHSYAGALGTSVVRVFDAVAGTTGLSLKQARDAGLDADSVVVHKEHHTSYYPDAKVVTVLVVYERGTGTILGGQVAGYAGADKRLDVLATAAASKLTVHELADVDFAYSPPIGTANDALNMAAYVAENRQSGFSPSVTAAELDTFVEGKEPLFIDVRDIFAFEKSHIEGAQHLPLELLLEHAHSLPHSRLLIVYDEHGKKGHQALRQLIGTGFTNVVNVSGGHTSLQRHARTVGFRHLTVGLLPIESKSVTKAQVENGEARHTVKERDTQAPLVVDVRTPGEFQLGAYPSAINIPLDDLETRLKEFGDHERDITVYCASGARSAYAERLLRKHGYKNVHNGGGIAHMMSRRK
jgi:NADPH-dependent 2,4-dienoyl-CoA reductase/sulfur reductase-like enzyme/rhodanese-related sulfurtransferase